MGWRQNFGDVCIRGDGVYRPTTVLLSGTRTTRPSGIKTPPEKAEDPLPWTGPTV
jgi:hypothetical protein